jgi:hypothetical protein
MGLDNRPGDEQPEAPASVVFRLTLREPLEDLAKESRRNTAAVVDRSGREVASGRARGLVVHDGTDRLGSRRIDDVA